MDTGVRTLYLGTGHSMGAHGPDGLFRCAASPGRISAPELVGLSGKGGIRNSLLVDVRDSGRVYAGTALDGVWRSDDSGSTWTECNRGLTYKEVWSLAQHPVTRTLWAGTGPAAIFRSDDFGDTWSECRSMRSMATVRHWTFPGPPFLAHVKAIGLDAAAPDTILAAVEEGWLVRSLDGGKSWENLQDGTEFDSHTAEALPGTNGVVLSTSGKGIFRSEDAGDTFCEASKGLERRYVTGIAFHQAQPQRVIAAASEVPPPFWRRPEGASAAFYRSADQGRSWTKVVTGVPEWFHAAPRSITQDPERPDVVYVGMTDGTLWCTTDGGDSFHKLLEGVPAPITAICVAAGAVPTSTPPHEIRGTS